MKESQCLLHLQRLFWTPFCLYFSARRPREILAAVRARASRDDTICSKNRNFDPYHRDKARSRAYGLLPLWLLFCSYVKSTRTTRKAALERTTQGKQHHSHRCFEHRRKYELVLDSYFPMPFTSESFTNFPLFKRGRL